jgi:hypothetical protein
LFAARVAANTVDMTEISPESWDGSGIPRGRDDMTHLSDGVPGVYSGVTWQADGVGGFRDATEAADALAMAIADVESEPDRYDANYGWIDRQLEKEAAISATRRRPHETRPADAEPTPEQASGDTDWSKVTESLFTFPENARTSTTRVVQPDGTVETETARSYTPNAEQQQLIDAIVAAHREEVEANSASEPSASDTAGQAPPSKRSWLAKLFRR